MRSVQMNRPIRLVLSNSYGTTNVGDQAILVSMIDALKKRLPNVRIDVLSRWPEKTRRRHPGVKAIRSGVFRGFFDTCRSIRKADVLIVGGGGLIQDASSFANLIFHLSRLILARLFRTPFVGCGLGVGPIESKFGRWLTGAVLKHARSMFVRDKPSAKFLQEIGIDNVPVIVTADFVLGMDFPEEPEKEEVYQKILKLKQEASCLIGLSLHPKYGKHKLLRSWICRSYRMPFFSRLLDNVARAIDELIEKLDAHIVFVSMHPEQDDPLFVEVQDRMQNRDRITLLSGALDPKVIMATVGLVDLLIGMRHHSVIFAARSCVPIVALGYDPKVAGLCALLGQDKQVIPLEEAGCTQLVNAVEDTWKRRRGISESLRQRLPELRARSQRNIEAIVELLLS